MSTPLQTKNEPLEQKKTYLNHENDYSRHSFGFDSKVKENNQPEYVVVQSKKKKQVIQISSSEGEAVEIPEKRRIIQKVPYAQFRPDKTKKIKKVIFRCSLCKASGKKSEMKLCINCKHNFHLACIQTQYGVPKRYVCDKCRFEKQQEIRQAQRKREIQERQLTMELEKVIPKKTEKQKKKEESQKKFIEFRERYPYYIQEDKIKFPIQDKLLFIYRELFQYNQTLKITPKPHPLIPSDLLGDFLQIQNFFSTFKQELQQISELPKDIRKSFLYIVMNNEGLDSTFQNLLSSLLKIYLNDIFEKNKTDNVKMLNQNCFFTLMINMNENEELTGNFLILAAQEIIRYLSTIPSMKKAFQNFVFPSKFNLNSKIQILVNLISGLSQVDSFHELVSSKSEKMQNLTKQKGELVTQLKNDEAQNLSNKQKLRQINLVQIQMEQQLALEQNLNNRQLSREKDKNKKKLLKLVSQKDKSQSSIKQIKTKIHQISRSLPFVTSQLIFLGKDRNQSFYFFFCEEPNRIYCQYHNYLLDDSPHFYMYEGKQAINELLKSLNLKGSSQKHLYDNIYSFIKQQIISATPASNSYQNQTSLDKVSYQTNNEEVNIQKVIDLLLISEQTFTNYLALKNLQWANDILRESFLIDLKGITNIIDLKQAVSNLQESFLFVQPISDQPKAKITILDSDQDEKNQKKQNTRKKSPVRLWGINSERIKKYWVEYLQQCIDVKGIWICTTILKNYVDRYVKKKMQYFIEQQKKQQKQQKQKEKQRLRKQKEERSSQKHSRDRSRDQRPKKVGRRKRSQQIQPSQDSYKRRPNLRQRRPKKLQIDSDVQYGSEDAEADMEDGSGECQQSNNDDCCEVCGEYGQMICCDTCPKVYHLDCLKIKQIPEGQWSCVHCLQKMANQRQTRSRVTRQTRNH